MAYTDDKILALFVIGDVRRWSAMHGHPTLVDVKHLLTSYRCEFAAYKMSKIGLQVTVTFFLTL